MRAPGFVMAFLVGLWLGAAAQAADIQCTTADRSAWSSPAKVKAMLEQHGFTNVGAPKPNEGNCYVVQATDNTGAKKTLYLDPTDGALMAVE
ncbi:MAG TPA: PepSY domain-containing protein [Dongiaceae bacterium]|nr:PepSY domain-containing protein [Dongiaceae bacterium]